MLLLVCYCSSLGSLLLTKIRPARAGNLLEKFPSLFSVNRVFFVAAFCTCMYVCPPPPSRSGCAAVFVSFIIVCDRIRRKTWLLYIVSPRPRPLTDLHFMNHLVLAPCFSPPLIKWNGLALPAIACAGSSAYTPHLFMIERVS